MLNKVVHDDFVWSAITNSVSGKRRAGGQIQINCPLCVKRGHSRPDRRQRLGIKRDPDGVEFNCFNCGAKGVYHLGDNLSKSMKDLLEGIGVSSMDVKRLNLKALQIRRMLTLNTDAALALPTIAKPNFPARAMPDGAFTIQEWAEQGCEDEDFLAVANYMFTRGEVIADPSRFYWTPNPDHSFNRRLILPFMWNGKIVGWTGRLIDKAKPGERLNKYYSEQPTHFMYNMEALDSDRKYIILSEGPFDAIATDGVATLGAKLSDEQAHWLSMSGKTIIVLADRDSSGQRMIDHALKHNWMVAFPKLGEGHGDRNWWDNDIKDAADASARYGKLYTIRSIIETATINRIEINVKRKLMV